MKRVSALILSMILWIVPLLTAPALAYDFASDYTPFGNSSSAKKHNIELAVQALDGTYVAYGDTFSFNDIVGPRTEKRGYRTAVNGRSSMVRGGGVAQVATTLYLALKQLGSDIKYTEKKTYDSRFSDDYVSSGKDAIITDYEAGTDFKFVNKYQDFVIRAWTDYDSVWCSIEEPWDDDFHDDDEEFDDDEFDDEEFDDDDFHGSEGYASTPIASGKSLLSNITLAANSVNDTTLGRNELFSFNDIVGPRTEAYGYKTAINGRGVNVTGGGVAQVASTIWLAIKDMDNIKIVEKKTYGDKYNQDYVRSANDAIVTDYSAGTDFSFRYTGSGTMTIYMFVSDGECVCEVYVN